MFIKLPIYKSEYKWSTDHTIEDYWLKVDSISGILPYKWDSVGSINKSLKQNPKDRPKICLLRAGADIFYCALTADEARKRIEKEMKKED